MPRTDRARSPHTKKAPKLSRLQKPADMSLEVELRRQFGREQKFRLKNLGDHPALSDFQVSNPASGNAYRVTGRELASPKAERTTDESSSLAQPAADPWTGLLQAGMALAQQWTSASSASPTADGLVRRDERTGETYLRLPVPSPEVVQQALQVVGALLQSFQSKR
jgi:hypothetical protein